MLKQGDTGDWRNQWVRKQKVTMSKLFSWQQ